MATKGTFLEFLKYHDKAVQLLGSLALLPPIIGLLPFEWTQYVFPPLGDFTVTAKVGLILFILAAIFCAYLLIGFRCLRAVVLTSAGFSLCCFLLYLSFASRFIRKVDDPVHGTFSMVSVGFERTDFANQNFKGSTDWDMLRSRSLREEDVQNLWTPHSIQIARTLLTASYFGILLGWVFAFSCVISWDLSKLLANAEKAKKAS